MNIPAYLRATRQTYKEFAEKAGRDETTVNRIARGKSKPSYDTIQAFIDASGGRIRADDFFKFPERKSAKKLSTSVINSSDEPERKVANA
jgi:transcriptional regulator with XRE-family HTH domain